MVADEDVFAGLLGFSLTLCIPYSLIILAFLWFGLTFLLLPLRIYTILLFFLHSPSSYCSRILL
jgi:hypothetical protein